MKNKWAWLILIGIAYLSQKNKTSTLSGLGDEGFALPIYGRVYPFRASPVKALTKSSVSAKASKTGHEFESIFHKKSHKPKFFSSSKISSNVKPSLDYSAFKSGSITTGTSSNVSNRGMSVRGVGCPCESGLGSMGCFGCLYASPYD